MTAYFILSVTLHAALVPELPPTVESLLGRVRAAAAPENAFLKATWDDLEDGKPARWEDQKAYRDSLGRMRLVLERGTYGSDKSRQRAADQPHRTDILYDGSTTLDLSVYPQWNRQGKPPKDQTEKLGYQTAGVFNGKHPPGGLETYRNPLLYLPNILLPVLSDAAAKKLTVKIERTESGQYTVEFKRTNEDAGVAKNVAVFDPAQGWSCLHIDSLAADGRLVRRNHCEYKADEKGNWLPQTGGTVYYDTARPATAGPLWEVRFKVSEMKLNDPEFDPGVFTIKVTPDTVIWDARYKVSYRVGDEETLGTRLSALAEEALQRRSPQHKADVNVVPVAESRPDLTSGAGMRRWVLVATGVIFLVAAIAFMLGRYRGGNAAGRRHPSEA